MTSQHNLDIRSYKFNELLDLFGLNYHSNLEELKSAKKIVVQMHPDKSRLPSEYFIFYKKAFEIIVDYFREAAKVQKAVPTTKQTYVATNDSHDEHVQRDAEQIRGTIEKMGSSNFQQKFNELYEQNMAKKIDTSRNEWFVNNDPLFEYDDPATRKDIGSSIDQIKMRTNAMIVYKGVQDYSYSAGGRFHDDVDEPTDQYISADPFGKLKFDDLRKVHKDQTVFSVSERDYDKMEKYANVEQYNRARSSQVLTPMEKEAAIRMMSEKERMEKELAAEKLHAMHLASMQYEEKAKNVRAAFLQIKG